MLADLITGTDLLGNNNTRQKFRNAVDVFKVDTRKPAKNFVHVAHAVCDLHGARFLACVKNADDSALLLEADEKGECEIVMADTGHLHYSSMLNEARLQLEAHLGAKATRKQAAATRKPRAKKNA